MFDTGEIDYATLTEKPYFSCQGDFILPDPTVYVDNDIVIIDNIVSGDFCDNVICFMEARGNWEKAKTVGEQFDGVKKEESQRQNDSASIAGFLSLDKNIFDIFNAGLNIVRKEYGGLAVSSDEGYGILRYRSGEYYSYHVDHGGPHQRVLSSLLYLNDDFDGGGTKFKNFDLTLQPKKGRLVFFPSSYTHEHKGCEVTNGTKYNIVTWYN